MTASTSFTEFIADQLSGLGPVSIRRMFGGAGVFADGVMMGLIAQDTFYLKCDATGRSEFESEGMGPFRYQTSNGTNTLNSYWQCPERLFDDPDEMLIWARRALAVALEGSKGGPGAKSGKPGSGRKRRQPK